MRDALRPALVMMALFTLVLGFAYPLGLTGVAQAAFPEQADGSLVRDQTGEVRGSALVGQSFSQEAYLHPRPSAAGDGYDASASSGSNLGPLNPDLTARVAAESDRLGAEMDRSALPEDAVTTSASGLDPHISPAYALAQARRIAAARGVAVEDVEDVIRTHIEGRSLGFVGQPRVNVLVTNLSLDARFGSV